MIVVDRVSKYYGSSPAVADLDFTIQEGECVGFLGLNGAGKSTTLRMLSCLLLPTSGRISVGGFDVEEHPHEIRKLIGYLPDTPPLYPEMRVREFVRFAGQLRRMSKADVEARLPEVLRVTGLDEVRDQAIGTLSHGYRQRVGIAQAIVHRPKLLILDEPIQGLDPVQIVEMRELIRGLRGQHTILLSSHILSEIERTCDRILMLHRGRIVAKGTEEELVQRSVKRAGAVTLEVEGDEHDAREALELDGIEVASVTTAPGGYLVIELRTEGDRRAEVARAVVTAGLGLLKLERTASALEEVFVQLSRDGEVEA